MSTIDPREVSVTVMEDDLRHDSESTHHSGASPTLSIYLPQAQPSAALTTASNSPTHSTSPTPHLDDEKTATSTSPPCTPPRPSTPPTRPPPPLLSSLRGPLSLPPHPLELHSPSPHLSNTSSPSSPPKPPPSAPHSTSAVFPHFAPPAPSTPSTRARLLEHRVGELDKVQQAQGRWVLTGAMTVTLLLLLTLVAFVAGLWYLTHRNPPPPPPSSITTLQLADASVTPPKLASGAVTLPSLTPPLASLFASLNATYQQALGLLPIAGPGLTQNLTARTLSLHLASPLTLTPLGQLTISPASITSAYLAPGAVTPTQLASGAVTAAAIAGGAVTGEGLGGDVVGWLDAINATAQAAWGGRVRAGGGIVVGAGGVVGVDYDRALFAVDASTNALTLAPHSITSALIAPYSIPLSALAPDFLSLIPTPGPGLTLANSSLLTLHVDPATLTLTSLNALTLAPSSITTAHLAPSSVTLPALGPDVFTALTRIANDSATALSNTQALLLTQSYLETQLLSAMNSTEAGLLQEVGNATNALWQAVTTVNASTAAAVAAVNASSTTLLSSLSAAVTDLSVALTTSAAAFAAEIPVAGAGLSQVGPVFSLVVDPALFAYPAGVLTLAPSAITSAYLQPGAVNTIAIAAGAVGAAQLAGGAVTVGKLAAPLQAVMAVLNPEVTGVGGVVSVGGGMNASVITRPPGGDLLVQGVTNGTVRVQAGGGRVAVSDAGVTVNASTFAVTAETVSVQAASTLTAAAPDLLVTSTAASLELSSTGAALTAAGSVSMTAGSVTLNASSSITVAAPNVTVTGSVQFRPVSLTVAGSTFAFDFAALPSTVVRLTGNVGASNLTFVGCGEGTAGTVLTVYNQLRSGVLHLPPSTCNNLFDVALQAGQRVTMTCAGLVNGVAALDCLRSELPQGGLTVQSSAGSIVNNTVNGVVSAVTTQGSVTLTFTPSTNLVSVSFVLDNPLLTTPGAAGAVMLTPMGSGTVNSQYSDAKQSPLWVCVRQLLSGQQLTVTLVNVGDALYINQTQQLQFAYQVL